MVWRKVVRPEEEVVDMIDSYGTFGRDEEVGDTCAHCRGGVAVDAAAFPLACINAG